MLAYFAEEFRGGNLEGLTTTEGLSDEWGSEEYTVLLWEDEKFSASRLPEANIFFRGID